ncbi:uncharacterized protein LOC141614171 [Silene latifolia]|uniref:uncharacterized protein LOC141614171 n=1 Tax=Silene latifolia TaxID=37657 RepID=UPI003D787FBC
MVGRDVEGKVVVVGCRRVTAWWEAAVAEAKALEFGVEIAAKMNFSNVIFGSDAKNVVSAVENGREDRCPFGLSVTDITDYVTSFISCRWSHVLWDGNTVAHHVARLCTESGNEVLYFSDFPDAILALAEIDLI